MSLSDHMIFSFAEVPRVSRDRERLNVMEERKWSFKEVRWREMREDLRRSLEEEVPEVGASQRAVRLNRLISWEDVYQE